MADGCTKPLSGQAFFKFLEDLGLKRGIIDSGAAEAEASTTPQANQLALRALLVGSVLISGASAAEEREDTNEEGFPPILVAGALLAAIGAVYVGHTVLNVAKTCVRRLHVQNEESGN